MTGKDSWPLSDRSSDKHIWALGKCLLKLCKHTKYQLFLDPIFIWKMVCVVHILVDYNP